MSHTTLQQKYIDSVDGEAHQSAVEIIGFLEMEAARPFDPPQEVIDAWPEDMPWLISDGALGWQFLGRGIRLGNIHEAYRAGEVDPRTLHHRSKFYPVES